MEPNTHRLLTKREAADRLAVSRSTVSRMIKDGTLPIVRVRQRGVRIKPSDLERLES